MGLALTKYINVMTEYAVTAQSTPRIVHGRYAALTIDVDTYCSQMICGISYSGEKLSRISPLNDTWRERPTQPGRYNFQTIGVIYNDMRSHILVDIKTNVQLIVHSSQIER